MLTMQHYKVLFLKISYFKFYQYNKQNNILIIFNLLNYIKILDTQFFLIAMKFFF